MPRLPVVQRIATINPTSLGVGGLERAGNIQARSALTAGRITDQALQVAEREAAEQQSAFDAQRSMSLSTQATEQYNATLDRMQQEGRKSGQVSHPDWPGQVLDQLKETHEELTTGGLLEGMSDRAAQQATMLSFQKMQDVYELARRSQKAETKANSKLSLSNALNGLTASAIGNPENLDQVLQNWDAAAGQFVGTLERSEARQLFNSGASTLINGSVRGFLEQGDYDAAQAVLDDEDNLPFLDANSRWALQHATNTADDADLKRLETQRQDTVAANALVLIREGKLTDTDTILNEIDLPYSQTKMLLDELNKETTRSDDFQARLDVSELRRSGQFEEARESLIQHAGAGNLSGDTFTSEMNRIQLATEGTPDEKDKQKAISSIESKINAGSGPDVAERFGMTPLDLSIRGTDWLNQWRDRVAENPKWKAKETRDEGLLFLKSLQDQDEAAAVKQGNPYMAMKDEDLDEAWRDLGRQRDQGQVTPELMQNLHNAEQAVRARGN